jgi:hypothetical protein
MADVKPLWWALLAAVLLIWIATCLDGSVL